MMEVILNINGVVVIMPEHARITVDFQNCQIADRCLHPTGKLEINARKEETNESNRESN